MGTLDDALEGLPDGNKKLERTIGENTPESLVIRAREIMGPILVQYFRGELGGQRGSGEIAVSNQFIPVIKDLGLDIFNIVPGKDGYARRILKAELNYLNDDIVKDMIKIILGEYSLETDIINLVQNGLHNLENLAFHIPEFKLFNDQLLTCQVPMYKEFLIATLNPYIIVMGMKPENRALATLAVKNREDKGAIKFINEKLPEELTKAQLIEYISQMTPMTINYLEVAKEYGVKEVLPAIADFKDSAENYIAIWGVR